MKLKEEFVKLPKEMVYNMYLSIVYDAKDYDDITRSKMLEEIVKEYSQDNYLYYICTKRELDFLEYIKDKKMNIEISDKYEWEIKELNKKCIFSNITYDIFEEQVDNVNAALDYYKEKKVKNDDLYIFMISVVRINGEMLTKALKSFVSSLFDMKEDDLDKVLGNPLIHFYLEFQRDYYEFLGGIEETVSYRDYYGILDDIRERRKEFGISGGKDYNLRDNFDMFYYGFNIRNSKVKKMYDEVSKSTLKDIIFKAVEEARVLNNRYMFNFLIHDDKLKKIINEAIDEMPCAVMNGFTPKEWEKQMKESIDISYKFSAIPQNNAHLCKNACDEFYKLYFGLLDYVNKKENINPKLGRIYKQEGLNVNELSLVDDYLWEHKDSLIDEYILKNPLDFSDEELEKIRGFKSAVTSDNFVIVGFDVDYTKILDPESGKLYMVKGVRANIDEILNNHESLPRVIRTTLLMFDGKIVFNSFLSTYDIEFGNDFNRSILEDMEKAIVYYHL